MAVDLANIMVGVFDHLTADSTFNTAMGGNDSTAGRIRFGSARDNETWPYTVIHVISMVPMNASVKDGYSIRVQFSIFEKLEDDSPEDIINDYDALTARLTRTAVSAGGHETMKPRQDITRGPFRVDEAWQIDADWIYEGFEN